MGRIAQPRWRHVLAHAIAGPTAMSRHERWRKRAFDLVLASVGLILAGPTMLALALVIRRTSPGPALYRHSRVGRKGRSIDVLKFRTMRHGRARAGPALTVAGDPRITRVGRILRRTKLDELPQLWNVVRGDMSLVGPRPDVPGYADALRGADRRLLDLRPGMTGVASLCFRREEDLLGSVEDPMRFYDEVLYPAKVRLDLDYMDRWSLRLDVALLAITAVPPLGRWLRVVPDVTLGADVLQDRPAADDGAEDDVSGRA